MLTFNRFNRSPAQQIVDLLLRNGALTIAELVEKLGVTTTAVRQQINRLLAEGWLEQSQRRQGPGRPAHVLTLSEQAKRALAPASDPIARLLLDEIADTEGPDRTRDILRGVGRRMARELHPHVGAGSAQQRVRNLADWLRQGGARVETVAARGGTTLTVFTCPYHDLAQEHHEICEIERAAVGEAVGGEVELQQCMSKGDRCCAFRLVRESASPRNTE